MATGIVDVWMQHPTLRHLNHDLFESLRRWMGLTTLEEPLPLDLTVATMDEGGVELTIVCGHIGYPWTTGMIAVADKHPNVYIDTRAYSANRYPGELVDYLKGRGSQKVLFGTNYPMMTAARALRYLGDLDLDDETRRRFLTDNARAVFSLD